MAGPCRGPWVIGDIAFKVVGPWVALSYTGCTCCPVLALTCTLAIATHAGHYFKGRTWSSLNPQDPVQSLSLQPCKLNQPLLISQVGHTRYFVEVTQRLLIKGNTFVSPLQSSFLRQKNVNIYVFRLNVMQKNSKMKSPKTKTWVFRPRTMKEGQFLRSVTGQRWWGLVLRNWGYSAGCLLRFFLVSLCIQGYGDSFPPFTQKEEVMR
jgi:hypothetical protein